MWQILRTAFFYHFSQLPFLARIIWVKQTNKRMKEVSAMQDSKITGQKYDFVCFRCGCIIKTGEKMVSLSVSVETPTEDGGLESIDATAISTLCSGCASALLSQAIARDPSLMMPREQEPEDDGIEEIDEDETEDEIDTDFSCFENIDDMLERVYYGHPSEEDDGNTGKDEEDEPGRRLRIRCSSKAFRLVLGCWKRVAKATSQFFTLHQRDIAQMDENNRKHRNITGQRGYGKMSPAEVYFALGQHFLKEEDWEGASNAFTSYIELESDNPLAYDRRGIAYGRAERYDEAIADFSRAISIDHTFAGAYNNRGLSYYKQYRFDEAIADYDMAIQLSPDVAIFYANRGLAHSYKEDLYVAIADYDKAIELDPTLPETHNNRGEAYVDLGEYEKALADFQYELALNPNDIVAYANRVSMAGISHNYPNPDSDDCEKGGL
jgi:tetratricopeptide (TPR) repeat protein